MTSWVMTRECITWSISQAGSGTVFEVGCGVGNTIYPLREECPALFFYGCDLSPRAVDIVKVCMLQHSNLNPKILLIQDELICSWITVLQIGNVSESPSVRFGKNKLFSKWYHVSRTSPDRSHPSRKCGSYHSDLRFVSLVPWDHGTCYSEY